VKTSLKLTAGLIAICLAAPFLYASADVVSPPASKALGSSETLLSPESSQSAGIPFTKSDTLPVPNKGLPTDLGQLIEAVFKWSLAVIGLVIFARFFYAGFLWFSSAGSADKTARAKDIMKNAIYGAFILFSAYLILNTINPDLVRSTFNLPGLPGGQAAGQAGPGGPVKPPAGAVCSKKFSSAPAGGCPDTGQCVDISNYTADHGCESADGKCLVSPQTAAKIKNLIDVYTAAGPACAVTISSALQLNNGPSESACHKPGSPNAGTCVDFNISPHDKCFAYFYAAAEKAGAVSLADEYVCQLQTTTGGNIHVNF